MGGETTLSVDVRVIAATNVDLKLLVDQGLFRRDLYYRLNVFPINVPPLRERKEDIPILAEVFLKNLNSYHMKNITKINPKVFEAFERYDWPGNIRELENVIERAYILEKSDVLSPNSFPREIMNGTSKSFSFFPLGGANLREVRRHAIEIAEKQYLVELLKQNNGRIDKTATAAGITTRQLRKLLKKYEINKQDFKVKGRTGTRAAA